MEELTFAEQIGPFLPFLGVIVGGIIVGGFAVYNRRKGNLEVKVPSVAEVWAKQVEQGKQLDLEVNHRRDLETKVAGLERDVRAANRRGDAYAAALEGTRNAFKTYVARIQRGGSNVLTKNEKTSLELPVELGDDAWHTINPQES